MLGRVAGTADSPTPALLTDAAVGDTDRASRLLPLIYEQLFAAGGFGACAIAGTNSSRASRTRSLATVVGNAWRRPWQAGPWVWFARGGGRSAPMAEQCQVDGS